MTTVPREGHSLRHALIDNVDADLCQAIDVRLARAKIPTLDRVVEQAPDAVAVVLIILGGVDSALRGDAMSSARRVLKAEATYLVAQLGQGRGG
jgi:hypothetical protein